MVIHHHHFPSQRKTKMCLLTWVLVVSYRCILCFPGVFEPHLFQPGEIFMISYYGSACLTAFPRLGFTFFCRWGLVNPYLVNFYETIFNSELVLCRIWLEEKEEHKSGNLCIETGAIRFVSWANKWPCWLKRDVEAKNSTTFCRTAFRCQSSSWSCGGKTRQKCKS